MKPKVEVKGKEGVSGLAKDAIPEDEDSFQPRHVHLRRWPGILGFGFSLRKDSHVISRLTLFSPAEAAKLSVGDRIVEVNGENIEKDSHAEVCEKIRNSGNQLSVLVVDSVADEYFKSKGTPISSSLACVHTVKAPLLKPGTEVPRNRNSWACDPIPVPEPATPCVGEEEKTYNPSQESSFPLRKAQSLNSLNRDPWREQGKQRHERRAERMTGITEIPGREQRELGAGRGQNSNENVTQSIQHTPAPVKTNKVTKVLQAVNDIETENRRETKGLTPTSSSSMKENQSPSFTPTQASPSQSFSNKAGEATPDKREIKPQSSVNAGNLHVTSRQKEGEIQYSVSRLQSRASGSTTSVANSPVQHHKARDPVPESQPAFQKHSPATYVHTQHKKAQTPTENHAPEAVGKAGSPCKNSPLNNKVLQKALVAELKHSLAPNEIRATSTTGHTLNRHGSFQKTEKPPVPTKIGTQPRRHEGSTSATLNERPDKLPEKSPSGKTSQPGNNLTSHFAGLSTSHNTTKTPITVYPAGFPKSGVHPSRPEAASHATQFNAPVLQMKNEIEIQNKSAGDEGQESKVLQKALVAELKHSLVLNGLKATLPTEESINRHDVSQKTKNPSVPTKTGTETRQEGGSGSRLNNFPEKSPNDETPRPGNVSNQVTSHPAAPSTSNDIKKAPFTVYPAEFQKSGDSKPAFRRPRPEAAGQTTQYNASRLQSGASGSTMSVASSPVHHHKAIDPVPESQPAYQTHSPATYIHTQHKKTEKPAENQMSEGVGKARSPSENNHLKTPAGTRSDDQNKRESGTQSSSQRHGAGPISDFQREKTEAANPKANFKTSNASISSGSPNKGREQSGNERDKRFTVQQNAGSAETPHTPKGFDLKASNSQAPISLQERPKPASSKHEMVANNITGREQPNETSFSQGQTAASTNQGHQTNAVPSLERAHPPASRAKGPKTSGNTRESQQFKYPTEASCTSPSHFLDDTDDGKYRDTQQAAEFCFPHYKMEASVPGYCLIINNKDFGSHARSRRFTPREGTDKDRDRLKAIFEKLNFKVKCLDNLTDSEMLQIIHKMSLKDHRKYDCFVCCVLTHGDIGILYGINERPVSIRDLTVPMRAQSCPTLAGKPKLFFFQACQGKEVHTGHAYVETDVALETASEKQLIPNEADFLLACATAPGYVSYRDKRDGTRFVTALTNYLDRFADKLDVQEILTLVTNDVSSQDVSVQGTTVKQCPYSTCTLRKKFVLRRPAKKK